MIRGIVAFGMFALATFSCMAAPNLPCGHTGDPPRIDGKSDDACWQHAAVATDFSVLGSGGKKRALRQTTVRAVWDDTALYLLAICLEPRPDTLSTRIKERDGEVWLDDAVEIFLRPPTPEGKAGDVVHLVINAAGVLFDQRAGNPSFDISGKPAVRVGKQEWTVEIAVRWRDLEVSPPRVGEEWGCNVGREHRPPEPPDWSTWAALKEGSQHFNVPELFGRLRFVKTSKETRHAGLIPIAGALLKNPCFVEQKDGKPRFWQPLPTTRCSEIAPLSRQYAVGGAAGYGLISQPLNVPAHAGDVYTVFAVLRGTPEATSGIAVVQEMQDGRPDDLYPFWDISLKPYWEAYSGRIVVDKGAKRLQRAILYRSNRKGRVECAYIQVIPGIHDVRGLVDITACTKPGERAVGPVAATPALHPFKPLPGGPIKTALFIGVYQRDAAELAQRLDLDMDVIACPPARSSRRVENNVAYDAKRVLGDLSTQRYNLIVLAGMPAERAVVDALVALVRNGAGMVVVEPITADKTATPDLLRSLQALFPRGPASKAFVRDMLGGLDMRVLDAGLGDRRLVKQIAAAEVGKGRIVRLTWQDSVPGLIPFRQGSGQYWEYRWALLAKAALWACRRNQGPVFGALTADKNTLTIPILAPYAPKTRVSVTWDTPDKPIPGPEISPAPYGAPRVRLELPLPAFLSHQRGPRIARVMLYRDGAACDLGAVPLPAATPRIQLAEMTCPEVARPGDVLPVTVTCTVIGKAEARVEAELIDAFGRVVDRDGPRSPQVGRSPLTFHLTMRDPLSVYHRVVITARDGNPAIAAVRQKEVFVPVVGEHHLDDFQLASGYAVMHIMCQPYLLDEFTHFLRTHGVTACTVNEDLIRRGMPAWGGTVAAAGFGNRHNAAVRPHCLSNPKVLEGMVKGTIAKVTQKRLWGFLGYNMSDEVHLSQNAATETCASKFCVEAFRRRMREIYGNIAAANREWGTDFASFAAVEMPRIKDMKGRTNPAEWVDYRVFMEEVWAHAYAVIAEAVRKKYPDVSLSFTNPYKFNSLSGTDFSRWVPHEQILLRYFYRHVLDRNRSWSHAPMLAWIGYRTGTEDLRHFMWWFTLNGGTMPIWWDPILPWAYAGKIGYTPWFMFDPLWRETPRGRAVSQAAMELETGLGKILRLAVPAPPEAVILNSQVSMHVLYARASLKAGHLVQTGYTTYHQADDAMAAALGRAGLNYTYVNSGALRAQDLRQVQVVVLPACVALSDSDVAALQHYVHDGGRLLADLPPGSYSAHGKPLSTASLPPALFDGRRGILLGHAAGKADAQALDQALHTLGAAPAWRVRGPDHASPGNVNIVRLRLGNTTIIGVVQGTGDSIEPNLVLHLPQARYLVDLRSNKALGRQTVVPFSLKKGDAAIFAAMPAEPHGLGVRAACTGNTVDVTATMRRNPLQRHVFRLELIPPGSRSPMTCYSRNLEAPAGKLVTAIPLGCDDPAGLWTLTARDALTGQRTQTTFMRAKPARRAASLDGP